LPGSPIFRYLVEGSRHAPEEFAGELERLLRAMNGKTQYCNLLPIPYFNGGLFAENSLGADDGLEVLNITEIPGALDILGEAADADWRYVNPTIFGTLFEGALDINKRAQLGAHYTSEADIRLVIDPVLMTPLWDQWNKTYAEATPLMQTFLNPGTSPEIIVQTETRLRNLRDTMLAQIKKMTVLDPACGSGNFLYVALKTLKNLERQIRNFFHPLAPHDFYDIVTPRQFFGIEKDPFAARLAHVVLWIGYLQWRYEDQGKLYWVRPREVPHACALTNPIIQDKLLDTDPERVTNDDAILRYDSDGKPYEPAWPSTSVIVSNPPFLGSQSLLAELGGTYTQALRNLYQGRVPGTADLVTYWFEKARKHLEENKTQRVGLISTNSIRGGANRRVLERIQKTGDIFMAWSDKDWKLPEKGGKSPKLLLVLSKAERKRN